MEYLNDINNFYKSIEEQNPRKGRQVLIMLDKMNAEMISDKILTSSNWTFYYRWIKMHKEQVHKLWKVKTTSSSGILKTIYHNGNYLLLFEKRKLQSFEI